MTACYPVSRCDLQSNMWHISSTVSGDLYELEKRKSKVAYLFYETRSVVDLCPLQGPSVDQFLEQGLLL